MGSLFEKFNSNFTERSIQYIHEMLHQRFPEMDILDIIPYCSNLPTSGQDGDVSDYWDGYERDGDGNKIGRVTILVGNVSPPSNTTVGCTVYFPTPFPDDDPSEVPTIVGKGSNLLFSNQQYLVFSRVFFDSDATEDHIVFNGWQITAQLPPAYRPETIFWDFQANMLEELDEAPSIQPFTVDDQNLEAVENCTLEDDATISLQNGVNDFTIAFDVLPCQGEEEGDQRELTGEDVLSILDLPSGVTAEILSMVLTGEGNYRVTLKVTRTLPVFFGSTVTLWQYIELDVENTLTGGEAHALRYSSAEFLDADGSYIDSVGFSADPTETVNTGVLGYVVNALDKIQSNYINGIEPDTGDKFSYLPLAGGGIQEFYGSVEDLPDGSIESPVLVKPSIDGVQLGVGDSSYGSLIFDWDIMLAGSYPISNPFGVDQELTGIENCSVTDDSKLLIEDDAGSFTFKAFKKQDGSLPDTNDIQSLFEFSETVTMPFVVESVEDIPETDFCLVTVSFTGGDDQNIGTYDATFHQMIKFTLDLSDLVEGDINVTGIKFIYTDETPADYIQTLGVLGGLGTVLQYGMYGYCKRNLLGIQIEFEDATSALSVRLSSGGDPEIIGEIPITVGVGVLSVYADYSESTDMISQDAGEINLVMKLVYA